MKYKKFLISLVAIIVIAVALYGVWAWQSDLANQPIRQEQEIR